MHFKEKKSSMASDPDWQVDLFLKEEISLKKENFKAIKHRETSLLIFKSERKNTQSKAKPIKAEIAGVYELVIGLD